MESEVQGTLLSDIKSQQIHWLWEKRIPRGQLTILDGDPGLGKSLLTIDLAARISTGRPMPDGTPGIQGDVILIAPEDDESSTIKPRVEAAGGDLSRVRLFSRIESTGHIKGKVNWSFFSLAEHVNNLAMTIYQTPSILVILDPLMAVLGQGFVVYPKVPKRKKDGYSLLE